MRAPQRVSTPAFYPSRPFSPVLSILKSPFLRIAVFVPLTCLLAGPVSYGTSSSYSFSATGGRGSKPVFLSSPTPQWRKYGSRDLHALCWCLKTHEAFLFLLRLFSRLLTPFPPFQLALPIGVGKRRGQTRTRTRIVQAGLWLGLDNEDFGYCSCTRIVAVTSIAYANTVPHTAADTERFPGQRGAGFTDLKYVDDLVRCEPVRSGGGFGGQDAVRIRTPHSAL
ncbi:hypothetical protein K438DRAFT_649192 [Mycena galopus ATCC 62051]|nr:hypothetical protein K438DRAFT_649192 [Mycena galopus ATCC 62051]